MYDYLTCDLYHFAFHLNLTYCLSHMRSYQAVQTSKFVLFLVVLVLFDMTLISVRERMTLTPPPKKKTRNWLVNITANTGNCAFLILKVFGCGVVIVLRRNDDLVDRYLDQSRKLDTF